jgi:hypothetical protein
MKQLKIYTECCICKQQRQESHLEQIPTPEHFLFKDQILIFRKGGKTNAK